MSKIQIMDTSNDYAIALQLQNDLVELTNTEHTHYIDSTKSTSNSGAMVDLTELEVNVKKTKRSAVNNTTQSMKRQRLQSVEDTESIVDHSWETLDPNPDIHGLFLAFNQHYFWGKLDSVMIQWSKRMTLCAGLCRYYNGFCSISLSEPLLKLRPRKDLVETLLHEMIHAYLFLTNNRDHKNRDGHGPEFCKHMYRINVTAGTNISIYHNFHDEVSLYRKHWWKCNGPCQYTGPFYGYVKRSINRAPGPCDKWWVNHQAICSGNFIKVKEPEGFGMKRNTVIPNVPKQSVNPKNKITNFIKILDSPKNKVHEDKNDSKSENNESNQHKRKQETCLDNELETTLCPVCNDTVFTEFLNEHLQNCSQLQEIFGNKNDDECKCPACNYVIDRSLMNEHLNNCNMLLNVFENDTVSIPECKMCVNCPNCYVEVKESNINEHLDNCISIESQKIIATKNEVKCPCCENTYKNIVELDDHIDKCLL